MLLRERQLMNLFKLGDWVISTKYPNLNPIQIESIYESNTRPGTLGLKSKGTVLYSDEVKLWQPKPNEWCWFWNVTDFDAPTLSRFCGMQDKLFRCTNSKQNLFTHCEPFIRQLPTSIKDQS